MPYTNLAGFASMFAISLTIAIALICGEYRIVHPICVLGFIWFCALTIIWMDYNMRHVGPFRKFSHQHEEWFWSEDYAIVSRGYRNKTSEDISAMWKDNVRNGMYWPFFFDPCENNSLPTTLYLLRSLQVLREEKYHDMFDMTDLKLKHILKYHKDGNKLNCLLCLLLIQPSSICPPFPGLEDEFENLGDYYLDIAKRRNAKAYLQLFKRYALKKDMIPCYEEISEDPDVYEVGDFNLVHGVLSQVNQGTLQLYM